MKQSVMAHKSKLFAENNLSTLGAEKQAHSLIATEVSVGTHGHMLFTHLCGGS